MGKKNKKIAKVQNFTKKKEEDENDSPFSKIVLKEKKEDVKKEIKSEKKEQIVGGYDPNASFADILANFERTGNPYAMPKKKGDAKAALSFAEILDKWEGKDKGSDKNAKREEKKEEKKSSYKATKSFAEILASYEGTPIAKEKEEAVEEAEKDAPNNIPLVRESVIDEEIEVALDKKEESPLFKKEGDEEWEKRSQEASWSIYGNNDSFERKEEVKDDLPPIVKEEKTSNKKTDNDKPKQKERIERPQQKKKEFSKILDNFDSKKKEVKTFEEIIKEKGDVAEKREHTISQLRAMLPQATLDLHGETQAEAEHKVKDFLSDCRAHNIRKISIITGKGLHSENGQGVLRDAVLKVLDSDGGISERGSSPRQYGGDGNLWVILKKID